MLVCYSAGKEVGRRCKPTQGFLAVKRDAGLVRVGSWGIGLENARPQPARHQLQRTLTACVPYLGL
jgi:hypothetical protein